MESLIVPGLLDSLKPIRDYVNHAAEIAGLDKKDRYSLFLAIDEVATNIVLHGYEEAGLTGDIKIDVDMTPDFLTIILEDTGKEYDPTTRELPTEEDLNQPLEERPIGGLGIFLTLDGIDEFQYKRINNRNRNTFIKRRSCPSNESPSP